MCKLKAIINLILSRRFFLFTERDDSLKAIHVGLRIRDAEVATGYLLDRAAETLACEEAVLTVKDLINKK